MNDKLIEGQITDIAFGGEGVMRVDGRVVFVPFTITGETVQARIVQEKKNFLRAELVEVLTPSSHRENPPCKHFQKCGGCQYQHMDYATEKSAKETQLRELLKRLGGIDRADIRPLISGPHYGYRNRITIHQEHGEVGFRTVDGQGLVDVEDCLLATPEVNRKLRHLRSKPHPRPHYSIRADAVMGEAFYQTNAPLMEQLQTIVTSAVSLEAKAILELYSGVGFFTEKLATREVQIATVESDPRAIEIARKKLPQQVHTILGATETSIHQALKHLDKTPLSCLVDPPREGLPDVVRRDIVESSATELIYLSCQPATLARDIRCMADAFEPVWFQPMDLFPRTAHLECLTCLKRK